MNEDEAEKRDEIYDFIRAIRDPERPENLEELDIVREEYIVVKCLAEDYYDITIQYKPTVDHWNGYSILSINKIEN